LSLSIASSEIKYHDFHDKEVLTEISAIAGKTEFDLKKESNFDYSEAEVKNAFQNAVAKLKELGAKQEIIDLVKKLFRPGGALR